MSFSYAAGVITQANEAGKSITAVAAIAGGLRFTVLANGYSDGDFVLITGTTDYNGAWTISNVAADAFDVLLDNNLSGIPSFTSSQTGTAARGDKDLSGFTGLTGVITEASGTGTPTVYSLSAVALQMNGALRHNPDEEVLIFDSSCDPDATNAIMYINGYYKYGNVFVAGAGLKRSKATGLIFYQDPIWNTRFTGFWNDNGKAGIRVEGSFDVDGGRMVMPTVLTSNTSVDKLRFHNCEFDWVNPANQAVFYGSGVGSAFDWVNVLMKGPRVEMNCSSLDFVSFDASVENAVSPALTGTAFSTGTGVPSTDFLEITNYTPVNNDFDHSIWGGGRKVRYIDATGDLIIATNNPAAKANNRGLIEETQRYKPVFVDTTFTPVENIKYHITDVDDASRENWTLTAPSVNYVDDRIYAGTSDVSGEGTEHQIVTKVCIHTSTAGSQNLPKSLRTNSDRLTVGYIGYNYNVGALPTVRLDGSGVKVDTKTVLIDMLITQTDQAIVDAYATIDDAYELYDSAKSYLYTNYAGEAATIVGRTGAQIDLGSVDLMVDSGAVSPFAFAAGNITVKSTTFTGGATATTGIAVFNNGAKPAGGTFNCDVQLNSGQDLTDVTIFGDLYINTGADSTLNFNDVTVTGIIYNGDVAHTLTINATGGSSLTAGDPGTGNGQTSIVTSVPITITVVDDSTGLPITTTDPRVLAYLTSDYSTEVINTAANASGVASAAWTGATGVDIEGWVREMSLDGIDYTPSSFSGTIQAGSGFSATVRLEHI